MYEDVMRLKRSAATTSPGFTSGWCFFAAHIAGTRHAVGEKKGCTGDVSSRTESPIGLLDFCRTRIRA